MLSQFQPSNRPVLDAVGGVAFAIIASYVFIHFGEIIAGEHHLDFGMLSMLLLLGVPVLLFARWEARRAV